MDGWNAYAASSFDRRAFLGADTVTAKEGICEADHAQTRLPELIGRH